MKLIKVKSEKGEIQSLFYTTYKLCTLCNYYSASGVFQLIQTAWRDSEPVLYCGFFTDALAVCKHHSRQIGLKKQQL